MNECTQAHCGLQRDALLRKNDRLNEKITELEATIAKHNEFFDFLRSMTKPMGVSDYHVAPCLSMGEDMRRAENHMKVGDE